jgi:hypothetical protein
MYPRSPLHPDSIAAHDEAVERANRSLNINDVKRCTDNALLNAYEKIKKEMKARKLK